MRRPHWPTRCGMRTSTGTRARASCPPTTRRSSSTWTFRRREGDVVKVFVAGGTGVLGAPLVRALVAAGHEVTGTSRTAARAGSVDAAGGRGVVCDALD